MFDVSWSELLVIAVVALIVIGPKELPGVLRMVGQWIGKIRRMASEFQGQFQEAMREAEMADVKKQVDDIATTAKSFTHIDPLADAQKDIDRMMGTAETPPATDAAAASATTGETSPQLSDATPDPGAATDAGKPAGVQH